MTETPSLPHGRHLMLHLGKVLGQYRLAEVNPQMLPPPDPLTAPLASL